jgi:cytochrome P450
VSDLRRAEIPTFLLAGHETTASGTSWGLFALAQRPDVQERLRDELRGLSLSTSSDPSNAHLDGETLDQLERLPLLDAVVRETLRLHAPVSGTARTAMRDEAIPVSAPYVDRNGVTRDVVHVAKDDTILVPIVLVNRSTELWGEDAHEWK